MIEYADLALVMGILTLALGLLKPEFMIFSGFIWVYSALDVFAEYGGGWVAITLGMGLLLLFEGVREIYEKQPH